MFVRRTTFNGKRRIDPCPSPEDLVAWENCVGYGGNPEHKRDPGDFGLTPPSDPRPDKTLCDGVKIFSRSVAEELLKKGISKGLVSKQQRNGFPQNVWAVSEDGVPLEAQLENQVAGTYHGYPMPESDPFRAEVFSEWRKQQANSTEE